MTPTRLPAEIRGDVPGLLVRGVPVWWRDEDTPYAVTWAAPTCDDDPDGNWNVMAAPESEPCLGVLDAAPNFAVDWTSPLALYAALHWLADRGHVATWMLPTTHGGRVEAWDGMSAWEVSAVLVSHDVRLREAGRPGIRDIAPAYRMLPNTRVYMGTIARASVYWTATEADRDYFIAPTRLGPDVRATPDHPGWLYTPPIGLTSWGMEVGAEAVAKINDCALADGCALLVHGGIVVPE